HQLPWGAWERAPGLAPQRATLWQILAASGRRVGVAGWPLSIRADQPTKTPLIAVLLAGRAEDPFSKLFTSAFPMLMKDERSSASIQKAEIQYRFSGGDTNATQDYARELIGMRPAVILAITNTSMAALHHENTNIPVVFVNVSDPVGMGCGKFGTPRRQRHRPHAI
ncbi:MAG: ABC transporter substrate binding protein, partial [Limisphaerales bacterium]